MNRRTVNAFIFAAAGCTGLVKPLDSPGTITEGTTCSGDFAALSHALPRRIDVSPGGSASQVTSSVAVATCSRNRHTVDGTSIRTAAHVIGGKVWRVLRDTPQTYFPARHQEITPYSILPSVSSTNSYPASVSNSDNGETPPSERLLRLIQIWAAAASSSTALARANTLSTR